MGARTANIHMSIERGKFITFEGGDGVGKSTQARLACEWLSGSGYEVLVTREPGGTRIGESIRGLLLDPENTEMTDMAEMLLYAAARAQLAREVIEPALSKGWLVLCDRWVDSSIVYQGAVRGLGEAVRKINIHAAGTLFLPDATILLDLDPAKALARTAGKNGEDRIEAMGAEYQEKVSAAYKKLAGLERDRIHLLDASGSPDEVHGRVRAVLEEVLSDRQPANI